MLVSIPSAISWRYAELKNYLVGYISWILLSVKYKLWGETLKTCKFVSLGLVASENNFVFYMCDLWYILSGIF